MMTCLFVLLMKDNVFLLVFTETGTFLLLPPLCTDISPPPTDLTLSSITIFQSFDWLASLAPKVSLSHHASCLRLP